MLVHELTRGECDGVLERMHIARLACARRNQPYVVPVSLAFDAGSRALVGFSTIGQKIEWMRENPRVCVAVDEILDPQHWTTVVVTGIYQEIAASDAELMGRAQAVLQKRMSWWLPATARTAQRTDRNIPVVFRIMIREVTGRRTRSTAR